MKQKTEIISEIINKNFCETDKEIVKSKIYNYAKNITFIYLEICWHKSVIHDQNDVSMFMDRMCTSFNVNHLQARVCGGFNPNKLKQFRKWQQFVKIRCTNIYLMHCNHLGDYMGRPWRMKFKGLNLNPSPINFWEIITAK